MFGFSTEISEVDIAAAIKSLRAALGRHSGRSRPIPQDEFGAMFGKKLAAVQRWEAGKNIPPGDVIIKMMQLCPDKESIEAFGVLIPQDERSKSRVKIQGEVEVKKREVEIRKAARQARQIYIQLRDRANAGDRLAKELLEPIVEDAIRAAGIATDPNLSKGRRKEALQAAIKKISSETLKSGKGV